MNQIGLVSYLAGAAAFGLLALLLAAAWRDRRRGWLLILACAVSAWWNGLLAWQSWSAPLTSFGLIAIEAVHAGAWFAVLLGLLTAQRGSRLPRAGRLGVHALWFGVLAFGLAGLATDGGRAALSIDGGWSIAAALLLALAGLVLVEQVYRNAREPERWALKFLCLGAGGMFAYDFYLYADGLLFRRIDATLWQARGAIHALITPLIGLSAARSAVWRSDIIISRRLAFFTTALTATGIYLVAVALGGYYIRAYGGSWGALAQTVFLFGALLMLLIVLFSGQARARLKVLLSKHLYSYKYDYRDEWLRLIRTLSADESEWPLAGRAVRAVSELVESPAGGLWLAREEGYVPCAGELAGWDAPVEPADSPFVQYLSAHEWIVDMAAQRAGEGPPELRLPDWLQAMPRAWLVVPLLRGSALTGFIVLAEPRAPQRLTWEDFDLLSTVGRQVAVDLAQYEAARRLSQAEQFQAYHRFAAFLMHDLKNVVAQLSLVVSNAAKFKHRAEFIDDAMQTVDNATQRMNRLLEQLRRGDLEDLPRRTDLVALCRSVAGRLADREPVPSLASDESELTVHVSPERLAHVLANLVRNAQEASPAGGRVTISVTAIDASARVVVEDTGCGMDARFVRERLFRPFDTTKGSRGMGLGAYEAREFIRRTGGEVAVDSEPGRGTRFIITLPLADSGREGRDPDGADGNQEAVNR